MNEENINKIKSVYETTKNSQIAQLISSSSKTVWKWILGHTVNSWKYIIITGLLLISLFTFNDWFRRCISDIRKKTEISDTPQQRANYSSDRSWNTCIFNTATYYSPKEVEKCDTKWGIGGKK